MKKFLVILLLLVYGFSSSGMTVNLHYCCGKLKSISWSSAPEKGCGSDHKMGSKPCCETKQISGKEHGDQEVQPFVSKKLVHFTEVLFPPAEASVVKHQPMKSGFATLAPPPNLSSPPLFILHCVYRI